MIEHKYRFSCPREIQIIKFFWGDSGDLNTLITLINSSFGVHSTTFFKSQWDPKQTCFIAKHVMYLFVSSFVIVYARVKLHT